MDQPSWSLRPLTSSVNCGITLPLSLSFPSSFVPGHESNLISPVAQPCNRNGNFLPFTSPPSDLDDNPTYAPFEDREAFEFAELMFSKAQVSKGNIDAILDIWGRRNTSQGLNEDSQIFSSAEEMYRIIDSVPHGNAPWKSVFLQYSGPIDADTPNWKRAKYELIVQDTRVVVGNMLSNTDFERHFDYVPYQEFESPHNVRYSNGMSGWWAYRVAVSAWTTNYSLSSHVSTDRSRRGSQYSPLDACPHRSWH